MFAGGRSADCCHIITKMTHCQAAKVHHPDVTGRSDQDRNQQFHDITEAYEILSDKERRLQYDMHHRSYRRKHTKRDRLGFVKCLVVCYKGIGIVTFLTTTG